MESVAVYSSTPLLSLKDQMAVFMGNGLSTFFTALFLEPHYFEILFT